MTRRVAGAAAPLESPNPQCGRVWRRVPTTNSTLNVSAEAAKAHPHLLGGRRRPNCLGPTGRLERRQGPGSTGYFRVPASRQLRTAVVKVRQLKGRAFSRVSTPEVPPPESKSEPCHVNVLVRQVAPSQMLSTLVDGLKYAAPAGKAAGP